MKHQTKLPKNALLSFHFNVIIECTKKSLYLTNNRSYLKKIFLILFLTVFVGISVAIQFYYNTFASYFLYPYIKRIETAESFTDTQSNKNRSTGTSKPLTGIVYPKVPEGIMTYKWFKSNRQYISNLGEAEEPKYSTSTPICHLKFSALGPISANKTELKLKWVEEQYPEISPGGFYAPVDCRPRHRVAILVPFRVSSSLPSSSSKKAKYRLNNNKRKILGFRNREKNLIIFLYHMHKFLKKQCLLYRIFVVEQYGDDKFNKGSLYNVAYIVSQQFGRWHCLIFHDVDLLPLNEQIFYSCPRLPTHMSSAVESFGYELPYPEIFGGVTALTPSQYETVNGYSNYYWNWGAEDDDMFIRLQARRYPILRYSKLIGRYATLPHERSSFSWENSMKLHTAKKRYQTDGLKSLEFKVNNVTKKKLFTHILTDINPRNIPHKK